MALTDEYPTRIFLECTRTWRSSLHTGIERVVRNIISASHEVGRSLGVDCQPVVYHPRQGFVSLPLFKQPEATPAAAMRSQSLLKRGLEQWGLIDIARTSRQRIQKLSYHLQSLWQPLSRSRLQFLPTDLLLLLDSSWGTPYWDEVRRAQHQGAKVGAMIYDLLPVQMPEFFTGHQVAQFRDWWNKAYLHADFVTSISQSVLQECLAYHQQVKTRETPLVGGAFRLGADFLRPQAGLPVHRELLAVANRNAQTTYLCVGTLSPRKQQALVLDAFDQLWGSGVKTSLFYIGGRGWHSEEFIRRMQSHAQFGRSLFWRNDLNDAELDYCYQRASGLITASLGEGFNLPIVEALSQGCSVIASDLPVHREVGGEHAAYFPKDDSAELARILKQRSPSKVATDDKLSQTFHWPNWQESCEELLQLILKLSGAPQNVESKSHSTAA